jgi:hypothetical protein
VSAPPRSSSHGDQKWTQGQRPIRASAQIPVEPCGRATVDEQSHAGGRLGPPEPPPSPRGATRSRCVPGGRTTSLSSWFARGRGGPNVPAAGRLARTPAETAAPASTSTTRMSTCGRRRRCFTAPVSLWVDLSTGCTECCGNVDYSTFANCGIFRFATPCALSEEAVDSLMRRARRGSRTKQHREVVRGGSQGPKRKVDRGCGRNRDRLGEFFWSDSAAAASPLPPRLGSPGCTRPVRRASTRA